MQGSKEEAELSSHHRAFYDDAGTIADD